MFESILPEWLDMTEWLQPKLVLLIALIATVLWLSNVGGSKRAREHKRPGPAPLKNWRL